jgi:hypothetical protein
VHIICHTKTEKLMTGAKSLFEFIFSKRNHA